jgi:hypothetical protein
MWIHGVFPHLLDNKLGKGYGAWLFKPLRKFRFALQVSSNETSFDIQQFSM